MTKTSLALSVEQTQAINTIRSKCSTREAEKLAWIGLLTLRGYRLDLQWDIIAENQKMLADRSSLWEVTFREKYKFY